MRAFKLFAQLTVYYVVLIIVVMAVVKIYPDTMLPIGGAQELLREPAKTIADVTSGAPDKAVRTFGQSLFWLSVASLGALACAFPVSWLYMAVRTTEDYDQSLVNTVVILPIVVTSIVIIVQNSLSLAFALGGIAGAVRFKNSLKSSGDALFILLSVGIGLAAGSGAVELALVMSIAFNAVFLALWLTEYGEREGMKRYLADYQMDEGAPAPVVAGTPEGAPPAPAVTQPPTTPPPVA